MHVYARGYGKYKFVEEFLLNYVFNLLWYKLRYGINVEIIMSQKVVLSQQK